MVALIIYLILSVILGIHWAQNRNEYRGRLMILPIIGLAIAGGAAIYQGIKGAKQKKEARKLQEEADKQEAANLSEARRMALTGMPEAEYQKALQNIYRNQSASLSSLRDRRMALAGATTVQQSTNDALQNLAAADAKARQQNQYNSLNLATRAAGMKSDRATYERQSGEAMTGAAMQNLFNTAGYASAYLGGNNGMGSSSLFGNSSDGAYNRMLLGTTPVTGSAAGQPISSGLSKPLPKLGYAKPY
jgi:hypothetical protein